MLKLFDQVREVVTANLQGPKIYLYPIYSYYFPMLSNKIKEMAQNIFAQYNLPDLKVRNNMECNESRFAEYRLAE